MSEHACKQGDAQCVWCMYRESARQLTEAREKLEAAERELRGAKASNDHHRAEADRLQAALSEAREALDQSTTVARETQAHADRLFAVLVTLLGDKQKARATLSPAPPSQCTCGDGHPYQYDCPTHPASPPSEAQGLSPGVTLAQAIPADEAADEMLGALFKKHAPSGGVDWEPCQHDDGALCVETCLPPAPPARAEGGCEVNCPCHMYGGTYSPTHCGACG